MTQPAPHPEGQTSDGNGDERSAEPSRWPKSLILIATVLAVVTVFSVWTRTQLLDTDEWVNLSTGLLEELVVQDALAEYLVDEFYTGTAVSAALEERLPANVQGLAAPLAGALRGPLTAGVERIITSSEFQTVWESANRIAHQALVRILRDETGAGTTTAGGEVALELRPLVMKVGDTIGVSQTRLDAIPQDAGRVTIVQSDELANAQQVVALLDFLAWFLLLLIVALYALAVYVGRGRRLLVLRDVGWSLILVGAVVLALQAVGGRIFVNELVDDPANRATAAVVASDATRLIRQMAWSALVYGALVLGFTSLLGDGRRARAIRRAVAPAFNASAGAVAGATVVALLLLLWWSPGEAFDSWSTGLVLIGVIIGAVVTIRHHTRQDFPDVTFDNHADASGQNP